MTNVIRKTARVIFGKLLPRIAYPVLRGPLKNAWFILGAMEGEGGGASVYFNMVEPEETKVFAETLKEGQTFFDIGANVGYYSILGSRLVGAEGKVLSFEPVARNLAYLYWHVVKNRSCNVMIISSACSDSVTMSVFSTGENNATGHLVENGEVCGTVSLVPTLSVDVVVQRTGIVPHVMKIDVEGAELPVLKGAEKTIREAKPTIFLSTHSANLRNDCLAYLKECGYQIEVLGDDRTDPSSFLATYSPRFAAADAQRDNN